MSDVYVYYFTEWYGPAAETMLSIRPATLAAIKGRGGEPVMESQIVVDHSELDSTGFFVAHIGNESHAVNALSAQIRSAELRAASRDSEALQMNDPAEGKGKYMLSLESRELRKEARRLNARRTELMAGEMSQCADTQDFVQFDSSALVIQ
jgi:hypothetical protein